jgi:hypothetical protein
MVEDRVTHPHIERIVVHGNDADDVEIREVIPKDARLANAAA